jgi:predicted dehydrogenase
MNAEPVIWGILGPGGIAREFLKGAESSTSGRIVAIGTRHPDRPDLAEHFSGLKVHGSYEALLSDPEIEAIYVATPHPFHAEWVAKAAAHGKHVLCEKPAGVSAEEVTAMFAAASANGTFLAEAYMYRAHPLTALMLQLLREGKVGDVRLIKSSFGFAIPAFLPNHRLFDPKLGGGAILDLGGYPMSMARLIAGCQSGDQPAEPDSITGFRRHGPTGVEEITTALVSFPNGIIADLSCSIGLWQDNVLHIQGTDGRLEIDSFWFGSGKYGGTASIRFTPTRGTTEIIPFDEPANVYSFQFEAANRAIRAGQTRLAYPAMSEADSLGNARALDRWLAETNLVQPPTPAPAG